jgi:hypothetical protein
VISPLLGNIFLHYVFDLWAERWRRQEARGGVIVVCYAYDLVAGFEHEDDARRFLDAMRERFAAFSLSLLTRDRSCEESGGGRGWSVRLWRINLFGAGSAGLGLPRRSITRSCTRYTCPPVFSKPHFAS